MSDDFDALIDRTNREIAQVDNEIENIKNQTRGQVLLDRSGPGLRLRRAGYIGKDKTWFDQYCQIRFIPHANKETLLALGPSFLRLLEQVQDLAPAGQAPPLDTPFKAPPAPTSLSASLDYKVQLQRLNPELLHVIGSELLGSFRASLALGLLNEHFPAQYEALDLNHYEGWWDILYHFLNLVEGAGWFPLHGELLDHQLEAWFRFGGSGQAMANWLSVIPVRVYAPTLVDMEAHAILRMLYALVVNRAVIPPDDPWWAEIGLERPHQTDRLFQQVQQTDFSHLDEPLCWLPQIAAIVARRTGNPLLDAAFNADLLVNDATFYWSSDTLKLRRAWQSARKPLEQYQFFLRWVDYDPPAHTRQVVAALLSGRWASG